MFVFEPLSITNVFKIYYEDINEKSIPYEIYRTNNEHWDINTKRNWKYTMEFWFKSNPFKKVLKLATKKLAEEGGWLVIKEAVEEVTEIAAKEGTGAVLSNFAKNGKKMSPDQIGEFLGAGRDWHKTSAKSKFLKQFKKELKGDTNADFYLDKVTKEVFLKSNKSGNLINTGLKF